MAMKRTVIIFLSLLFFLFSVGGGVALDDDTLKNLGVSPGKFKQSMKEREEKKKQCSSSEDKFVESVIYGKRIAAFEMCKRQGGGVDECIQRINSISEGWKQECANFMGSDLKDFYLASLMLVNMVKATNEGLVDKKMLAQMPTARRMGYLEGLNKYLAQLQPGSNFSFTTGTGKVVFEQGEVYFQNWEWTQYSLVQDRGITINVFPKRVDIVLGRNALAFHLPKIEVNNFEWELMDFSLPFDMQTERLLLTLNKGVRITEKEIIRLADNFFKNTAWSINIMDVSKDLLASQNTRKAFIEGMVEFYAYDNYIAKVKAEAKRQEKQQGGQSGGAKKKK
jgi:hypothetical protein